MYFVKMSIAAFVAINLWFVISYMQLIKVVFNEMLFKVFGYKLSDAICLSDLI